MNPSVQPDTSLPEYLATRARATSDGRLVLDVALGVLAAVLLGALRPAAWLILASAATCFAAFGIWGIADRELRERENAPRTRLVPILTAVRALATLMGALAIAL